MTEFQQKHMSDIKSRVKSFSDTSKLRSALAEDEKTSSIISNLDKDELLLTFADILEEQKQMHMKKLREQVTAKLTTSPSIFCNFIRIIFYFIIYLLKIDIISPTLRKIKEFYST